MSLDNMLAKLFADPGEGLLDKYGRALDECHRPEVVPLFAQLGLFSLAGIAEKLKMNVLRPGYIDTNPATTCESAYEAFLYHGGDFFDGVMYTTLSQLFGQPAVRVMKQWSEKRLGTQSLAYRATDWCERHFDGISAGIGVTAIIIGETAGQGGDTPDFLDMPAGFLGVLATKGVQLAARYVQARHLSRKLQRMPDKSAFY